MPIDTEKGPSSLTVKTAELGDNVTLYCTVLRAKIRNAHWYKQSLGSVPQKVASNVNQSVKVYPPFNSSFTVDETKFIAYNLKIRPITKGDEANYFCEEGDSWNGIFLSVRGI